VARANPDPVLVDVTDGVATITLNRPEKRNVLDPVLFAELARAFVQFDERDDVRAILLTGAGESFCAGADLSGGTEVFRREGFERFRELSRETSAEAASESDVDVDPRRLLTPVIAAVNGVAAGGGLTLALQCDIVIVADDATLALPFVRRGLVAERNAHWILPRTIGTQATLELLLTGRKFTGREAAQMGLVARATDRASVLDEARRIAREIAENAAPSAAAATKRLVYGGLEQGDASAARDAERAVFQELAAAPDCSEGLAAYRDRRPPNWKGTKRDIPESLRRGRKE